MKNYWVKSGLLSLAEKLSVQVFAFGSVYLLLRGLTVAKFGIWALFLAIASVVEVARIGLLQNALVKFLSTDKKDYSKISTASLVLNLILTAITVGSLILFSGPIAKLFGFPELASLLKIYAMTNIALFPFFQFNYIQQANLDFHGIFWANFARQGLFFILVLYVYLSGAAFNLVQLAEFQIFAAILGSIVAYIFCRRFLSFSKAIDLLWIKKLFHFGKFVFGTNVSTMLYKSVDKFLLGMLPNAGAVSVGLYETAIKITNLTDVPTFSMSSILFPQSARRSLEGNHAVKTLYEKAVGAIMALMIPSIIGVWVLAKWIILIVAGSKYIEAVPVLRITMLYGLFIPFAVQFGTVLDSIGMPRTNFFFTLFNLFLLLIIDYFFILQFGVMGAAYGTLLTYVLTFVIMQYYLNKKLQVQPFNAFKYAFVFYRQAFQLIKNKLSKSNKADNAACQLTNAKDRLDEEVYNEKSRI